MTKKDVREQLWEFLGQATIFLDVTIALVIVLIFCVVAATIKYLFS